MTLPTKTQHNTACKSGLHHWLDKEDRIRCCNGYVRVHAYLRSDLEAINAEHLVYRQLWRGWQRVVPE